MLVVEIEIVCRLVVMFFVFCICAVAIFAVAVDMLLLTLLPTMFVPTAIATTIMATIATIKATSLIVDLRLTSSALMSIGL